MTETEPRTQDGNRHQSWLKPDVICVLVLALLTVIVHEAMLLRGRYSLMSDHAVYMIGSSAYFKECVLSGEFPLWNPYASCGEPYLAGIYSLGGAYFPHWLPVLLLPIGLAIRIIVPLHVFMAGVFMYAYLRTHLRVYSACLLGAIVYMLNAHGLTRQQFFIWGYVYALVPLTLIAWEYALRCPSVLTFLIAGATLALQFFAGHTQVQLLAGGLLVLSWLHEVWRALAGRMGARRLAGLAAAAVLTPVFALQFAMFHAIMVLEYSHLCSRSLGVDWTTATAFSLPPAHLLSLLVPNLFGTADPDAFWSGRVGWYWNGACYVGLAALPLTLAGAVLKLKDGGCAEKRPGSWSTLRLLCVVGIAAGFGIALGKYLPVLAVLRQVFPPLKTMRWPSLSLVTAMFGLAVGTALGWSVLTDRLARARNGSEAEARRLLSAGRWAWRLAFVLALLACGLWLWPEAFSCPAKALVRSTLNADWEKRAFDASGPQFLNGQRWFCIMALACCAWFWLTSRLAARRYDAPEQPPLSAERTAWRGSTASLALAVGLALLSIDLICVGKPLWITSSVDIAAPLHDGTDAHDRTGHLGRAWAHNVERVLSRLHGVRRTEPYALLRSVGVPNFNLLDRRFHAWGLGPIWPARWALVTIPLRQPEAPDEVRLRMLGFLGVVEEIVHEPIPGPGLKTRCAKRRVPEDLRLPRAWIATSTVAMKQWDAAHAIPKGSYDLRSVALLETRNPDEVSILPRPLRNAARATSVSKPVCTANTVSLQAELDGEGILVLADTYYLGWEAFVDGRPTEIFPVDVLYRGVRIGPGRHEVLFRYRPKIFVLGLRCSGAVCALTLILLGLCALRRTRPRLFRTGVWTFVIGPRRASTAQGGEATTP